MEASATSVIQVGDISVEFLVEAGDSDASVTVFECLIPGGARVPIQHSHDAFDETIYGLEGVCTWTVDGDTREVGPGESVFIRRGRVHGFENRSGEAAKFLAIATPGVFGPAYFDEMAEILAATAGGPPDLAALGEAMRRHGLTPAPPAAT